MWTIGDSAAVRFINALKTTKKKLGDRVLKESTASIIQETPESFIAEALPQKPRGTKDSLILGSTKKRTSSWE